MGNKPRVREGTQLDLPVVNQKSGDAKDYARLYKWSWLDNILHKSGSNIYLDLISYSSNKLYLLTLSMSRLAPVLEQTLDLS